jgi:hypothetical protein
LFPISRFVEKLCVAMYSCLFDEDVTVDGANGVPEPRKYDENGEVILEESDHMAVVAVHSFLQVPRKIIL